MADRFSERDTLLGTRAAADDGRMGYIQQVQTVNADGSDPNAPVSSATVTSVDSATASTNILAANAARKGAIITNTDENSLYLDLSGGTASATNYSVELATDGTYQVPFGYTGAITGIWAVDGTGAALVTEFE